METKGSLPHSQEPTVTILSNINPVHAPNLTSLKIHHSVENEYEKQP
jgi:hypothetical protein